MFQGTSPLTQAMGWVMEFLTNTTYPRYKTISTSHTAEGVLLFVCSVLRYIAVIVKLKVKIVTVEMSPLKEIAFKKAKLYIHN